MWEGVGGSGREGGHGRELETLNELGTLTKELWVRHS